MSRLHQVIVGNTLEKGLDILATTLSKNQIRDITPFLPKFRPLNFNGFYVTKYQYLPGKIMIQFTFDSETDHFGRDTLRTHTLIIDENYYNEKTALFFVSPLIHDRLDPYNEVLLTENDFEELSSSPVSSKLLEQCLCRKFIALISPSEINQKDVILIFATLDRAIPPPFNRLFSFQTMVSLDIKNISKKRSIIYSAGEFPNTINIDDIKFKESEFSIIKAIYTSIGNLMDLREQQKKLFSEKLEKRLKMKIQWRFGVKLYSDVKENLSDYFY